MKQKDFSAQVKNLLKGETINSAQFWSALQQQNLQDNASQYCWQIFENLSAPNKHNFVFQNEEKLYSTLLAIEYYKSRKPKEQYKINKCQKFVKQGIIGHTKWIMNVFMSPLKDENFAKNFMNRLIMAPLQIDWNINIHNQMQQQKKQSQQYFFYFKQKKKKSQYYFRISAASFPRIIAPQSKIISLAYVCFLDYVRGNFNQLKQQQLMHAMDIIKVLINYQKTSSAASDYLAAFLHFIINCFTFYSYPHQSLIKQLIIYAEHLRSNPGVIGHLAQQLFDILYKQLKIPGNAFRKKLRCDFPSLDIKTSTFLNKQFYFITQNQDSFSCPEDRSLTNLRKLIIWHIMKISCFEQQEIQQYFQMLRDLPNDFTFQLYFKAMKIIDIAGQLEVLDKIKQVLKKQLSQVLKQTNQLFIQQGLKSSQLEAEQFQSLVNEKNSLHIFRYPLYEILHVPLSNFLSSNSQMNFYNILKKSRLYHSSLVFYRELISFIFYGNSNDFSKIVQILAKFVQQADIEQCRQLQIFYLPKPEASYCQSVGCYIACKDIWYRRFIYNIFKQQVIFPNLELNSKTKNLFPSYIMNKSVHMYLRQAKRIFYLKVYKCTLKMKDTSETVVVYFTGSLLLGIFAEAEAIRITKLKKIQKVPKYSTISSLEIIKQKLSKRIKLTADIGLQYIEPLNNQIVQKKESNLVFEDLQICNLPKEYFFGEKPDPSGKNLKLSILTEANAKCFWKQLNNKQNFRQNKGTQEICHAFKQLFIAFPIKSMTIKNKNQQQSFKVVIDGELYQKVEHILVQSPTSIYGLPLALPILTFLPFK